MTPDPAIVAAYRAAMKVNPIPVTVIRINGVTPNAAQVEAQVNAIIGSYAPDTIVVQQGGYASSKPGAITQGDRMVILLADDLIAQRFPMPLKKHDRILLPSGDVLDIVAVDALKRAIAGAIELKAAGVA